MSEKTMLTVAQFTEVKKSGKNQGKAGPRFVEVPLSIDAAKRVTAARTALKEIRESEGWIKATKALSDARTGALAAILDHYNVEPGAEVIVSDRYTDGLTFTVVPAGSARNKGKEDAGMKFQFTVK